MLVGTCYNCSAPAMFTCTVCGRTVCISCYKKDSRLCRNCHKKLGLGIDDDTEDLPPGTTYGNEGIEEEEFYDDEY